MFPEFSQNLLIYSIPTMFLFDSKKYKSKKSLNFDFKSRKSEKKSQNCDVKEEDS